MRTRSQTLSTESAVITIKGGVSGTYTVTMPAHYIGRSNQSFEYLENGVYHLVQWLGVRRPAMEVECVTPAGTVSVSVPEKIWQRVAKTASSSQIKFKTRGHVPSLSQYLADLALDTVASLNPDATDTDPTVVCVPVLLQDQTTRDVVTKSFAKRRAAGEVIINPFHSITRDVRVMLSSFELKPTLSFHQRSNYSPGLAPRSWGSGDVYYLPGVRRPNGSYVYPGSIVSDLKPDGDLYHYGQMIYEGQIGSVVSKSPVYEGIEDDLMSLSCESVLSSLPLDEIRPTDLSGAALERAHDNLNDSEAELAVELAELGETVEMLYKTMSNLSKFLRDLRRGRITTLRNYCKKTWKQSERKLRKKYGQKPSSAAVANDVVTNEFSGAWLEARYGWRPLVISVNQAINGFNLQRPPRRTFRGELANSGNLNQGSDTMTIDCTYRAGVIGEFQNVSPAGVLGLYNFGTLALDMTPFSFVAGWFINLSAVASKFNPSPIYKSLGSYVTRTELVTFQRIVFDPADSNHPLHGIITEPIVAYGTVRVKERIANPQRSFFSIDLRLNTAKFVDLAALTRKVLMR